MVHVFIDSSVWPKMKSFGCYVVLDSTEFIESKDFIKNIKSAVVPINLETKVSTDAELELALYVLENIDDITHLYTDCNNLYNIVNRKYSRSHKNAQMYDKLIKLLTDVTLVKVKGHNKKDKQINDYDRIFCYVDRQARKTLRQYKNDHLRKISAQQHQCTS